MFCMIYFSFVYEIKCFDFDAHSNEKLKNNIELHSVFLNVVYQYTYKWSLYGYLKTSFSRLVTTLQKYKLFNLTKNTTIIKVH